MTVNKKANRCTNFYYCNQKLTAPLGRPKMLPFLLPEYSSLCYTNTETHTHTRTNTRTLYTVQFIWFL